MGNPVLVRGPQAVGAPEGTDSRDLSQGDDCRGPLTLELTAVRPLLHDPAIGLTCKKKVETIAYVQKFRRGRGEGVFKPLPNSKKIRLRRAFDSIVCFVYGCCVIQAFQG